MQVFRQLFCNYLSAGDGDKSGDMVALDGDIGRSNEELLTCVS